jgi:hypothetical protein
VRQRAPDDPQRGPLGYLVRTGAFTDEPAAVALREELVAAGYDAAPVVFTGEDGGHTTGPWVVHVLEVDPVAFGGGIVPAPGTDVAPRVSC